MPWSILVVQINPGMGRRALSRESDSLYWDHSDSYAWMSRVTAMEPVVVTAAVNGGVQGRESHPGLPETPAEIAAAAFDAYNAGASVVHIHPRDPQNLGQCASDPEACREVNALVRERCPDMVINNTTGGDNNTSMEARFAVLRALPEVASINTGPDMSRFTVPARSADIPHPREELNVDTCVPFTYGFIESLALQMKELGIKPEMEFYHSGNYWVSRSLIEKKLIEPPYYFQYVMGYQTSAFPTPRNLMNLVDELPADSIFSVVGIGRFQWPMVTMALILGGNVRVGLEDNLYLRRGQKLVSSAEAVEKVVRIATELGRQVATPSEARRILGLPAQPSQY